jgi:hypothetical protein
LGLPILEFVPGEALNAEFNFFKQESYCFIRFIIVANVHTFLLEEKDRFFLVGSGANSYNQFATNNWLGMANPSKQ